MAYGTLTEKLYPRCIVGQHIKVRWCRNSWAIGKWPDYKTRAITRSCKIFLHVLYNHRYCLSTMTCHNQHQNRYTHYPLTQWCPSLQRYLITRLEIASIIPRTMNQWAIICALWMKSISVIITWLPDKGSIVVALYYELIRVNNACALSENDTCTVHSVRRCPVTSLTPHV